MDLYTIFLDLLIPEKRASALVTLRNFCPQDSYDFLEKELASPRYSHRVCSLPLCRLSIELKRYLLLHDSNGRSPRHKLREILCRILKNLEKSMPGQNFKGKKILDLGAGVYNPALTAALFRLLGAQEVVAYEICPTDITLSRNSLEDLFSYVIFDNPVNPDIVQSRKILADLIASLDTSVLKAGKGHLANGIYLWTGEKLDFLAYKEYFDFIFSISVLEHVHDFKREISSIHSMLSRNGAGLHIVDFGDHMFGNEGMLHAFIHGKKADKTLNKLRLHEILDIIRDANLNVEVCTWSKAELSPDDFDALRRQYPGAEPVEYLAAQNAALLITKK